MIDLSFINVAVSLIFIYLIVSLMISGIIETVFSYNRFKAKKLEFGLEHLFYDEKWKSIIKKVKDSPFINSLKRTREEFPAHIPPENFMRALLDVLTDGNPSPENIKKIDRENSGDCGAFISQLNTICQGELKKVEDCIKTYFENARDRISGWYTRKAKLWSFLVSIVVCALFNLDSVNITISLLKNPADVAKIADVAATIADNSNLEKTNVMVGNDSILTYHLTMKTVNVTDSTMKTRKVLKPKDLKLQLKSLPAPVGWTEASFPAGNWRQIIIQVLQKIFGIAISAAAISMGAPFWYDLLKRISPLGKTKVEKTK